MGTTLILVDRKYALRHLIAVARMQKRTCEAALLEQELRSVEKEIGL
jgi:hypothetical protein